MDGGGASACALLCMRVRSALDVGRGGALCFWDAGGDLAAGACRGGRGVVRWGEGVGLRGQRRQVLRVGTWRLRRLPAPAVHAVVGAMGHERQQTRTDSLGPLLAQLTTHPSHGSTSSFPWERESRASL